MIGLVWICAVGFALDYATAYTGDQNDTSPCPVKWIEIRDVYSRGASYRYEAVNVDACKELCKTRIKGCVAVERHAENFDNCWTHSKSLDKVEKERVNWKGATQFILVKDCPYSTLTPTTKHYEGTLQSFTKTDAAGKGQSSAETIDNKPQRVTNEGKPQSFTESTESKSHSFTEIDEVPCSVKWMELQDVLTPGSEYHMEIRSILACKEACKDRIKGCVAVERHAARFDNCWTHSKSLDKVEKERQTWKGATQFVLVKDCPSSTLTPTTKHYGETLQSLTKTDAASKEYSSSTLTFTTETAEIITSVSTLAPTTETAERHQASTWASSTETVQQSPAETLTSITETPEINPTVILTPTTETDATSTIDSGDGSGESVSPPEPETDCLNRFHGWTKYRNSFTANAKLYTRVRGPAACKRACVEMIPGCVAVEYHISGYCWYHDKVIEFGKCRLRLKDFVLYVRTGLCQNTNSAQQPFLFLQLQVGVFG